MPASLPLWRCQAAVVYWFGETVRAIREAESRSSRTRCLPIRDGDRRERVFIYASNLAHYGRLVQRHKEVLDAAS